MDARRIAGTLLDLVYPRSCAGCGAASPSGSMHVCWDCFASFHVITEPFCEICGDPVAGRVDHDFTCGACRRKRPNFDLARSAASYRGALRTVLHGFKYERLTCVSDDLVQLLRACVATHYADRRFDAVVSVPLHVVRERERTYNQSALLAAGLARAIGVEFWRRSVRRVRATESQTTLSARERRSNVRGAFECISPAWAEGRSFLLIDDVMTTGATVNEVADVLRDAGAVNVCVATVARG